MFFLSRNVCPGPRLTLFHLILCFLILSFSFLSSHSYLLILIFSFFSSHFLRVITDGADGEVKARESWREEQYKKRQEEVEASKVTTLHCVWILFSVSGFYSVCLDSFQCVWILFTVSGFLMLIYPILGVVHLSGRIHSH